MREDVKQLWIDALQSGQYVQGKTELRKQLNDGSFAYCCLGVLCELYIIHMHEGAWSDSNELFGESAYLPDDVMEWAGIETNNGRYNSTIDAEWSLVDDNDGTTDKAPKSFPEIATIIKENF